MSSPDSRNNLSSILITIVFLVFFGALYFFIYMPNNEKKVQEQRFRSLQNIDKNIHSKIENSVALMNNLLAAYVQDTSNTYLKKYIAAYPRERFILSLEQPKHAKDYKQRDIPDSGYRITVNNADQRITLQLQKQTDKAGDTIFYQMSMLMTFDQFIRNLLPANVFDEYIVFSNGNTVYETFSSGITSLKDTIEGKNNGFVTSTVRSVNAGGRDYKLFLEQVSFTSDQKWSLAGLLSNSRYQQEKNQLPSHIVLFLVTAMLIITVALPWIKLYQMGSKDRLTTTDGIASIVVAMLLMSLLFFSFFKYNRSLRPVESPDAKLILANQIITALQNEIDTFYHKLMVADTFVLNNKSCLADVHHLHKFDTTNLLTSYVKDTTPITRSVIKDTSINQVYWLDSTGNETANWIASDMNAPHGRFANRDYFSKIIQQKEYRLNNEAGKPYYFDQVISWVTGRFTSVISTHSINPHKAVAAISFNMHSLNRPVLPTGYQFALIDNTAKVLYHSDISRNLNENLLTEFSAYKRLMSCMQARSQDVFTTEYFSKEYNVLYKPLYTLPYSIVIFSDLSYKEARDTEIYSFTISMLAILFATFIMQLLVVFLLSAKRSTFKKQLFDTGWIGPKISSLGEYNIAIFFNLAVIILVVIFFNISTFLTYVFILLFSVTFISVFLTTLFKKRYESKQQFEFVRFKKLTIRWLCIFIVLLNLAALKTLDGDSYRLFLGYQVVVFILGRVFYIFGERFCNKVLSSFPATFANWDFVKAFALMSLTRLIITSGIPLAFFYVSSYNYEQNISVRYRQLQYADQLMNKFPNASLYKINEDSSRYDRGFYNDSAWIRDVKIIDKLPVEHYSNEDSLTANILGTFRLNFSDIAINDSKFHISQASDSSFFYNPLLKDACKKERSTITYRKTGTPGKLLRLTASSLNYKIPSVFSSAKVNGLLFWIILLAAIVIFYFIIYSIITKLFSLRLHDLDIWNKIDTKILSTDSLNNLVFIIGLPGSGKLKQVKEKIKNGELVNPSNPFIFDEDDKDLNNVYIADLINIPDSGDEATRNAACNKVINGAFKKDYALIIVNHFEYNIRDTTTNRIKLNFLERLMLESKSKIIILSTIHPITFLDSFIDPATAENSKADSDQDLERWHVLLGHYRIVVFSLKEGDKLAIEDSLTSVYDETRHTHFLKKMQNTALGVAREIPENKRMAKNDQLIFKLQVTAHYFYMYIWQSLTKEEKFLLYDLAEDNLVNSVDEYNLNMLLAKGIISRPDGTLQLFNKGFRNFILTAIGNTEAMKIKNRIKDNGNWSRLKVPLLIVLVAILAFLITFQEEAYSRILAYIAALGTGVPAILKLFSLFDKKSAPKE